MGEITMNIQCPNCNKYFISTIIKKIGVPRRKCPYCKKGDYETK